MKKIGILLGLGLILTWGCQQNELTPSSSSDVKKALATTATCTNYRYEGAMAGNNAGAGSAWWYYYNTIGVAQNIYASKSMVIGSFTVDALGNFSIQLSDGWELKSNISEPVKIQGYDVAPSSRPSFGKFGGASAYKGNSISGRIQTPKPIYVASFEVQKCLDVTQEIAGLVASYPFDGNANDASGNNHNALENDATLATGRKGNANSAYSFNGSNQRIGLGDWFTYNEFTVSMWVNPSETQNNEYANIIDNNHAYNVSWVVQQNSWSTNNYYSGISSNVLIAINDFSLAANQWQHLVIVKSADAVSIYINNNLVSTQTYSGTLNFPYSTYLSLGSHAGRYRFWNGTMDDIKLFNRALSASELTQLYQE